MPRQKKWTRRLLAALVAASFLSLTALATAWAAPPRRVVSANLCADQLLVTLADRNQIAGLSVYSSNRDQSFVAHAAQQFPKVRGGEAIVALHPDLVLTGPYDDRATRAFLAASGIPVDVISPWRSLADGYQQIGQLAARLGHNHRGEALIDRIKAAMRQALELARARKGPPPTAVVLGHDGFVQEGGALWEILKAVGWRDDGSRLGLRHSGFVPLEALISAHPDNLILSQGLLRAQDEGDAFLLNPALRSLYSDRSVYVAPKSLWECDGPSTPEFIRVMTELINARSAK